MRRKRETIVVTAGEVESWTMGPRPLADRADWSESNLFKALNAAREEISRGDKTKIEIIVVITQ
jgi:hypothetical protein